MINSNYFIKLFYKSMFDNKDIEFREKKYSLKKINGLRQYQIGNLLFIEQNKNKKSEWADKAKAGTRIMWVIDTKTNKYLVLVYEGKIFGFPNKLWLD